MARQSDITYEKVAAIADTIKGEGGKPTTRLVRERLGNIGSMATIHKHMQTWSANQARPVSGTLSLPPGLQQAMLDFLDKEVAKAKGALEGELAELQHECADFVIENERQAAEIEEKAEVILTLQAENASRQGRIAQMEADLASSQGESKVQREAAEAARTELAKALLRLEAMPRLEADLDAVRTELARERQARITAEQSSAVFAAQRADLIERLDESKTFAQQARAAAERDSEQLASTRAELADLRVAVQAGQGKLDAATREIEDLRKASDQAQSEAKQAAREAGELRGKLAGDSASEGKAKPK